MRVEIGSEVARVIERQLLAGHFESPEDLVREAVMKIHGNNAQEERDLVVRQKDARKRLLAELATLPPGSSSPPKMNAIDQTLYGDPYT